MVAPPFADGFLFLSFFLKLSVPFSVLFTDFAVVVARRLSFLVYILESAQILLAPHAQQCTLSALVFKPHGFQTAPLPNCTALLEQSPQTASPPLKECHQRASEQGSCGSLRDEGLAICAILLTVAQTVPQKLACIPRWFDDTRNPPALGCRNAAVNSRAEHPTPARRQSKRMPRLLGSRHHASRGCSTVCPQRRRARCGQSIRLSL